MPREAPVTSAILPARGGGLISLSSSIGTRKAQWQPAALNREGSARLGQERQLARRVVLRGLIGEPGRIVAGEAVVGELRARRVAHLVAHGPVDALDRQEG